MTTSKVTDHNLTCFNRLLSRLLCNKTKFNPHLTQVHFFCNKSITNDIVMTKVLLQQFH